MEEMGRVKLRDIGFRHGRLFGVNREDGGAVLPSGVRTLPIELRRIVSHREEHLEQLSICDLPRIEGDLDGLGVARRAVVRQFIDSRALCATGVARHRIGDSFDVLEDTLYTPETAAGEYRYCR